MKKTTPAALALIALFSAPAAGAGEAYIEAGYTMKTSSLDRTGTPPWNKVDPETLKFKKGMTDFTNGTLHGRFGYDFNQYMGVEAEVGFGVGTDSITTFSKEEYARYQTSVASAVEKWDKGIHLYGDIKTLGSAGLYGRAIWPIGKRLNVFARAGLAFQQYEFNTSNNGQSRADRTGFAWGAGASFDVSDTVYVRGDYTRVSYNNLGTTALFRQVGYSFSDDDIVGEIVEISRMDADVNQFSLSVGFRF